MNHEQASELLTQYLLGDLDRAAMAEVKSHLETCEACRAAVREIEPTLGLLRDALAAPSNAPEQLDVDRHVKIITRSSSRRGKIVQWLGENWLARRQSRLVDVAAILVVMFIFAGLLLPALSSSRKMSTRVADRNSLSAISAAMRAYAMENNGKMPNDLNDLRGRYINDMALKSRSSGEEVQFFSGAQSADSSSRADLPIAALHAKNGGNLLYKDGSVRWMDDKEFKKEIAPKLPESRAYERSELSGSAGQGVALSRSTPHMFAGGYGGAEESIAPAPAAQAAAPGPADKLNAQIAFDGYAKKDALKNYPVVSRPDAGKDQDFKYSLSRDDSSGAKGLAPSTQPSMPQPSSGGRQSSAAAETPAANAQNEVTSTKVVGYEKQEKAKTSGTGDLDTPFQDERANRGGALKVIRMGEAEPEFEDDSAAAPAEAKPSEPLHVIAIGGAVDAKELEKEKNAPPDYARKRSSNELNPEGGASAPPSPQAIKVIRMGEASSIASSGEPSDKTAPEGSIVVKMYDWSPDLSEKLAVMAQTNGVVDYQKHSDWKGFFADLGVQWPEGSKIKYLSTLNKVVVANTSENLSQFEELLRTAATNALPPPGRTERMVQIIWNSLKRMTPEKSPKWKEDEEALKKRTEIIERLEKINIPEIELRQADIKDAVRFLNDASARFDQSDLRGKAVNMELSLGAIISTPEIDIPPVTFSARHISVMEALKIATEVTKLEYRIDSEGVHIISRNLPEKVITREYSCPPDFGKLVSQASEELASTNQYHDLLPATIRPDDWQSMFGELGVEWPTGSSIKYVPEQNKIIVVNSLENIGILERLLAEQPKEPEPEPTAARFKASGVNPFVDTAQNAFSTFAIDCDTASYTVMRNYITKGYLPPAESVRTEEFVNFFDYSYAPPAHDTFAVYVDAAPSRFGHGLTMLKIGVKGRRLGREEQRRAVLTFLVDTSGSMNKPDRIGLVKKSLKMLVEKMNPQDMIAIMQFDSHARLVLELTPASDKKKILDAIDALQCSGSTNMEEGMHKAYEAAARNFLPGGENRVLIMSDGVANLGTMEAADILKGVETYRKQGIFCSVFGVGIGTYNDEMLQQLANKGDGSYTFIDSEEEARRVLVDDLSATLNTIAKDVKIQVEFNPAAVKRYRQLGYESRQLKKEDFRNDTVDAGEVGSGQSVTALYELEAAPGAGVQRSVPALRSSKSEAGFGVQKSEITDLKSAQNEERSSFGPSTPLRAGTLHSALGTSLGTVRVRYKRTDNGKIEEIEQPITADQIAKRFDDADSRFRLAACAAEFSEILRGSPFAEGNDVDEVANALRPVALDLGLDFRVQELLRLVQSAKGMPRGE